MSDARTWMPLYVADYLADTRHLSTAEHGAYLLLIMHAWMNEGRLPLDEKRLARIAGMDAKEWKEAREVILDFFEQHEDCFRHKRVDAELDGGQRRPPIPTHIRRGVFDRDGERCAYCGTTEGPFEIDHIQPLSRGGSNDIDNLTVACAPCNRSKGAKTLNEWRGEAA